MFWQMHSVPWLVVMEKPLAGGRFSVGFQACLRCVKVGQTSPLVIVSIEEELFLTRRLVCAALSNPLFPLVVLE